MPPSDRSTKGSVLAHVTEYPRGSCTSFRHGWIQVCAALAGQVWVRGSAPELRPGIERIPKAQGKTALPRTTGEEKPGEQNQQTSTPALVHRSQSPSSLHESSLHPTASAEGAGRNPDRSPPTDCQSPTRSARMTQPFSHVHLASERETA